jgi:hypothetical protein
VGRLRPAHHQFSYGEPADHKRICEAVDWAALVLARSRRDPERLWGVKRKPVQFRYDFQNPFKWYCLGTPNTGLNLQNINKTGNTFGKIGVGSEDSTVGEGGMPLQNLTLAVRF